MIRYIFLAFIILPHFLWSQASNGRLAVGTQFYQNLMLPDFYEGSGIGLNLQLDIAKGFGLEANYMYEALDLQNSGNIKRFQNGVAVNYVPFHKQNFSPWVQIGLSINTINITPVSYLFSDNSDKMITQNYFGINMGLGAKYRINENLTVNSGFYFQPQNYSPSYILNSTENGNELETNIKAEGLTVKPLLYFNLGFTYQLAKLW